MASSAYDGNQSLRPAFSDDEVLAIVCQLGPGADAISIGQWLSGRLHHELDVGSVRRRLGRLREEGLIRFVPGAARGHVHARLTAAGVERLQSLQREPLRPATE